MNLYEELLELYRHTDEYKRFMAVGCDVTSYTYSGPPVHIFFEIPHKTIYYKKYRIYAVEFFFGIWTKSVGKESLIREKKCPILHIELAGLNKLYSLEVDYFSIYIESNEFAELLSERKRPLLYIPDIFCNTDMSNVRLECISDVKNKTVIKSYKNLMSYIESNVKILASDLWFKLDIEKEDEDDIYAYIDLILNNDILESVFGKNLSKKNFKFEIAVPMLAHDIRYSIHNIILAKFLIDKYVSLVNKKDKSDRIFKNAVIYFYIINEYSSNLKQDLISNRTYYNRIKDNFNDAYLMDVKYLTDLKLEIRCLFGH